MYRKILSLMMAFVMLLTVAPVCAEETPKTNKAITLLSDLGVIDLTKEDPDMSVTRGEMVKLLAHVLNKGEVPKAEGECIYTDVTDPDLINAVMWANKENIIKGSTGTEFEPDTNITMQDAYVMVVRILGFEKRKTVKYPSGHLSYVDIFALDNNLKHKKKTDNVTYSDVATMIYNMLSRQDATSLDGAGSMLMETVYGKKGLKVLTFNTRNSYTGDGINSFIYRIGFVADKIYKEDPDIIGLQELTTVKAFDMMEKILADYIIVGPGKNRGKTVTGTYIAIKKDTCTLVGWDSIWLSDTPHIADSRFEVQGKSPRICVQALVRHNASGQLFRVFNTHLDNEEKSAQVKGMEVVLDYIDEYKEKGNYPIMLMGDLNASPEDEAIVKCNQYEGISEVSENVTVTFHKYGTESKKLDYIFMSDELAKVAGNAEAWTDMQNGIYLSDHYPVCTQLWF